MMNPQFRYKVESKAKVKSLRPNETKAKLFSHMVCLISKLTVAPRLHKRLISEINKWYVNNGPEWTVNRIKAYWNAALILKDKSTDYKKLLITLYRDNLIKFHNGKLIPKGPLGKVVQTFVEAKKAKTLKRASAVLRIYTSIRLDTLTNKQYEKYFQAICSEYTGKTVLSAKDIFPKELNPRDHKYRSLREFGHYITINSRMLHWMKEIVQKYNKPIHQLSYNPWEHLKGKSFYYDRDRLYKDLNKNYKIQFGNKFEKFSDKPYVKMVSSLISQPYIPSTLWKYCTDITWFYNEPTRKDFISYEKYLTLTRYPEMDDPAHVMGQIKVIQEQGAKARVVAMPTAALQRAFEPMNYILKNITKYIHESCVLDQSKGVYNIIAHNQKGHNVISIDLSSATDRFPREISKGVLDALGMSDYARALEIVSNSAWEDVQKEDGIYKNYKYYRVGQPMGLQGSFSLFNLTNILLANYISHMLELAYKTQKGESLLSFNEINGRSVYFYVIGDDIVFSDKRIADEYRRILSSIGVKISENKSFSNNISEFAGYITYKTGKINKDGTIQSIAFRPYKVPDKGYITNPLQLLDVVRNNVVKLNRRKSHWVEVLKAYTKTLYMRDPITLEPYSPIAKDHEVIIIDGVEVIVKHNDDENIKVKFINDISLDEFLSLLNNTYIQRYELPNKIILGDQVITIRTVGRSDMTHLYAKLKYLLPSLLFKNRKPDLSEDIRNYDPNSFIEKKTSEEFEPLKKISNDPLIRKNKGSSLSIS